MKCIQNIKTEDVFRVTNVLANAAVQDGKYRYVEKSIWKKAGRPEHVPAELRKLALIKKVPAKV